MIHRKTLAALLLATSLLPACALGDAVYRWLDADGVIHISSEKPPAGVQAERIEVRASSGKSGGGGNSAPSRATASSAGPAASPEQLAARQDLIGSLRNRECVIALEALDRLTSGSQPTSTAELRRLQQTAELNCSKDPARRREQEEMAARLRVAGSPACVEARNRLAALLEQGAKVDREQLKAQQDFVAGHCTAPVR